MSLDWFMTIPGILITCGIVLLVIAVILFLLGSKRTKKSVNTVVEGNASAPVTTDYQTVTPIETVETVVDAGLGINSMWEAPTSEPVMAPVDTPVQFEEPVFSFDTPIAVEEVTPVVTDDVVVGDVEVQEPVVYGGEVPKVEMNNEFDTPVSIYGGNDPLEATQTLPKVEEHHEPYGGAEVKIVEPTFAPTYVPTFEPSMEEATMTMPAFEMPTPVEEPVTVMPTFEMPVEEVTAPVYEDVQPIVIDEPVQIEEPVQTVEPVIIPEVIETPVSVVEEL